MIEKDNSKDKGINNIIVEFIKKSNLNAVKNLIKNKKIDINMKVDDNGSSLLHIAVLYDNNISQGEVVNFLLKNGADPNQLDNYGNKASFYSIKNSPTYNLLKKAEKLKLEESKKTTESSSKFFKNKKEMNLRNLTKKELPPSLPSSDIELLKNLGEEFNISYVNNSDL